ncbi:hypothetical protein ACJX0J_036829, partial [Zea mays]
YTIQDNFEAFKDRFHSLSMFFPERILVIILVLLIALLHLNSEVADVLNYFSGLLLLQLMHNFLFNGSTASSIFCTIYNFVGFGGPLEREELGGGGMEKVINGSMSDARVKAVTVKPGLHRFGADGFIGESQRMGHRGPDPDHPETRYAEEIKVVIYKHYIIITCDVSRQQQQQQISPVQRFMHVGNMYQSEEIIKTRQRVGIIFSSKHTWAFAQHGDILQSNSEDMDHM